MAQKAPSIPLPKDWPKHVKVGILHVIALAHVALTEVRARSATRDIIARLRAGLEEAQREICLLEEELRLKDLRMERVTPRRRPHYSGTERMTILELRAAGEMVEVSDRRSPSPSTRHDCGMDEADR